MLSTETRRRNLRIDVPRAPATEGSVIVIHSPGGSGVLDTSVDSEADDVSTSGSSDVDEADRTEISPQLSVPRSLMVQAVPISPPVAAGQVLTLAGPILRQTGVVHQDSGGGFLSWLISLLTRPRRRSFETGEILMV